MVAINPNESHKNRHSLFMGMSGSGKTYYLGRHPWLKGSGKRLIVWDPYESHKVHYRKSLKDCGRQLAAAVRSKKGFKIGLSVNPTKNNYEAFCQMVWAALDGKKETFIIVEELADVTGSGKGQGAWGQLVRVGRKYGAIIMPTTQRPQDIDKTLFTQSSRIWCGLVSGYDRAYVEKNLDLQRGALADIVPESYKFVYKHGPNIQWGGPRQKKVTI